jgi:DNA-binding CsgD family transcriptional regulator
MSRSISFDQATVSLLDAAIDPTRWEKAMDTVAQYAGASGAVLLPFQGRGPGIPHSASLGEGFELYFKEEWHLRDERERGVPHILSKGLYVDQDIASREELDSLDYYQGFLRKLDMHWSVGVGFVNDDDGWCLVIERGERGGFFDRREQADLVRFGPYLNRAAQLSRQLAYANATGMLDAFEALGCASFLLDHNGRVIRDNAQAQHLIGDGLTLSHGQLRCSHPADSLKLSQLTSALSRPSTLTLAEPPPAVVARRITKRPLMIQGIPLAGLASTVFSPATSILLVSDTEQQPPPTDIMRTQEMFGLTGKESALLSLLEQEIRLRSAAEMMGISSETARSHLKRILAKTGTTRQADLLLLLRHIHRLRR